MKKHILLIDPLSKLVPAKDSSLMFALSLKERGYDVALVFEEDFFITNNQIPSMRVYDFDGSFEEDGCYIKDFKLTTERFWSADSSSILHMRLDPPFDGRYLRFLWMQKFLKSKGVEVLNDPDGVLLFNEKLYAYEHESSLETYVGSSKEGFLVFVQEMKKKGHTELILKPLDLYQGIGVEKVSLDQDYKEVFLKKVADYNGPVVVQPFAKEVTNGEVRSLYFKGKELGSILKVPKEGEYLANIAQGATYDKYELTSSQRTACEEICQELSKYGVDWIAFDILGESISEVNITCPGLLVEVSKAYGKNLSFDIIDLL
jgi:glutathione synthase